MKRRIQTTLIPTRLVINEVKRRKKLELDMDEDAAVSSTMDANGKANNANGNQDANDNANDKDNAGEKADESEKSDPPPPTVPKSNDDFRKLFNI